jgi:hypothetical protein
MNPNLRILITISLPVLIFLLLNSSCTHETFDLSQMDTVCFESQIFPLIQNSCGTAGCHNGISGVEGFSAVSYESILQAVKPGDPKGSRLYDVITNIWGENFMPPDNPLPLEDRNLILVWIEQGALKTTCQSDTANGNPPPPSVVIDTICFVQDILPVFVSGCATSGCHDAVSHSEGYNLTSYTSIMNHSEGIVPFSPGSSKIFEAITENEPDDRMPPPPQAPLTATQIDNIRTWILDGALNSDCPQNNCDTLSPISFSEQVFPILETNCLSCHNTTPANGGVMLTNYDNVKKVVETGRNGISLLVGAIRYLNGFTGMPPVYHLDECSLRTVELWIEQGFQNN